MTKAELRVKLKSGDALDEVVGFTEMDCDHWIFKAESFRRGDEILYVPDLTMDCISTDAIFESDDEIEDFLGGCCYTGDDFVDLCGLCHVDESYAERLFQICDWRHPLDILNDGWPDKEVSETMKRKGYRREPCEEPLVLEPEEWTPEEWRTLCKLCKLPDEITERIVIHASEIESNVGEHMTIELGWPDEIVKAFKRAVSDVAPTENHGGNDYRTYTVTELCPHCGNEIEMRWNTDALGYKAFCPVCGKRLMLCDECRHTDGIGDCDYDSGSDTCRFNSAEEIDRVVVQIEGGMVTGIYGSGTNVKVEVLDLDTADADQATENQKSIIAVKSDISAGRLVEIK